MNTGTGLQIQANTLSTSDRTLNTVDVPHQLIAAFRIEAHKLTAETTKHQSGEAAGLLFGQISGTSVKLDRFEIVEQIPAPLSSQQQLRHTRIYTAFSEYLSKRQLGAADELTGLVGWFVISPALKAGLTESDVALQNTLFPGPQRLMLLLRRESKDQSLLELYTARPGMLLSQNDHRAGLASSRDLTDSSDPLTVELHEKGDDELFLNVYRTAKSLDKAESKGRWNAVWSYTSRLRFVFSSSNNSKSTFQNLSHCETSTPVVQEPALKAPSGQPVLTAPAEKAAVLPSPALYQSSLPLPAESASAGNARSVAGWMVVTALISFLTYIAAHLYIKPLLLKVSAGYQAQAKVPQPAPASLPSPQDLLNLRIEPRSNGLLEVSWSSQSPVVQNAASGTLWMTDNLHVLRSIPLSADDLKSGRIMYMPVSADTTFHLQVTDRSGHETTRWVRVLNDSQPAHSVHAASRQPAGQRVEPSPQPTPNKDVPAAPTPEQSRQTPIQLPASSTAIPVPENKLQVDHASLPASYVQRLASSLPRTSNDNQPPSVKPVPGPPGSTATVPVSRALPAVPKVTTAPPQIRYKYVPSLPVMLGERLDLYVPVLVSIDATGSVTSASMTSQNKSVPKYIADTALSAARKWRFSPATVNGNPVPSDMTLQFHFARQSH